MQSMTSACAPSFSSRRAKAIMAGMAKAVSTRDSVWDGPEVRVVTETVSPF
jgi:hypothetical protein